MSSLANLIITLLSLGTLVALVALGLLVVWLAIGYFNRSTSESIRPLILWVSANALRIGLIVSLVSVAGSLFFSNVVGFLPCELCWWQRIFLYPQVVIFAAALLYERRGKPIGPVFEISAVLSAISFLISLFQYYGSTWNENLLAVCSTTGVSCAKTYFVEFGFITIPVMSLTASALLLAIVLSRRFA